MTLSADMRIKWDLESREFSFPVQTFFYYMYSWIYSIEIYLVYERSKITKHAPIVCIYF